MPWTGAEGGVLGGVVVFVEVILQRGLLRGESCTAGM